MTRLRADGFNGSSEHIACIAGMFNMGIIMVMKSRFGKVISAALAATAMLAAATPANAVTFNLTITAGTSAQAIAGFNAAAARWAAIFTDNVTIDLTVGTATLGAGILGQAGSIRSSFTYSAFKTALTGDITSATDATAVANLAAGAALPMMINYTSDNPNGAGSATSYLDTTGANNTTIRMTNANAKALGLTPTLGTNTLCVGNCDAGIQFSDAFAFDYDPSDGITAGQYDFVGVATHEIGHALGFISGVDVLDGNSSTSFFTADQFTFVNTLDVFRYSALSAGTAGGVSDFSAGNSNKYFSIDRGVTGQSLLFSTGRVHGDGQQASHWKDSLGIGIMDPTAGQGELLAISANDIRAFDVIGWNLRTAAPAVPEPGTWMMMLAGFGLVGLARRRRPAGVVATV